MLKKLLIAALIPAVLLGLLASPVGDPLILRYMQRQVVENLSGQHFADFADGLNVVLCGAGSPMPDTTRADPCVAVVAGPHILIVDAGSGSVRNLSAAGIPVGKVQAVLLTHFHSDHIDGLGELLLQRWGNAAHDTPTPVIGPTGVEQVVQGFNLAYQQDFGYRVAHHGPKIMPPTGAGGSAQPFALPGPGQSVTVLDDGGLKVVAFAVDHRPILPAVGYRIDYKGRSVLISGDTRKSDNLQHFAKGVDLLVHEALAPQLLDVVTAGSREAGVANITQITLDIHNYHTTPVEAAQIAQAAGAKQLLYYHLVPPLPLPLRRLEKIFTRGVSDVYSGGVTVGHDRTWVSLPANSTEVRVKQR